MLPVVDFNVAHGVCLAVLAVAAGYDLRVRRIPNRVVISGAVIGMAMGAALDDGIGIVAALLGLGLGLLVFMPLYLLRATGAGDVKLVAMVGAYLGPQDLLGAILAIFLAGGIMTVVVACHRGVLKLAISNIRGLLLEVFLRMASGQLPRLEELPAPAARAPYGVAIAAGTLLYLGLGTAYGVRL